MGALPILKLITPKEEKVENVQLNKTEAKKNVYSLPLCEQIDESKG